MLVSDLDYDLPEDRIAIAPAEPRDSARLMVIERFSGSVHHMLVRDLPDLHARFGVGPRSGDLMVFNQSRVLPALFQGTRRGTGGRVGGLYLRSDHHGDEERWHVMLESRGTLTPGEHIDLTPDAALELLESKGGGEWIARLRAAESTVQLLTRIGQTPLPPYIQKARKHHHAPAVTPEDTQRYNTVYASRDGSVAAPTAGLHFTPELLGRLDAQGVSRAMVTLHVGMGTFAPVRSQRVEDHDIHCETIDVPADAIASLRAARQRGGRILVVGTTTVRALESLPPDWQSHEPTRGHTGDTKLFIVPNDPKTTPGQPPFAFRFTDVLMTNFHLPRSTLMALVAALPGVGLDNLKRWYTVAIAEGYRFYSYGDAMLLV